MFNKRKIKELEAKIEELENEIEKKKRTIYEYSRTEKNISETNKNLSSALETEINENKKLNEWVIKILKEFGTTTVKEKHVAIPVIKNTSWVTMQENGLIKDEVIEIPSITIHRQERLYGV